MLSLIYCPYLSVDNRQVFKFHKKKKKIQICLVVFLILTVLYLSLLQVSCEDRSALDRYLQQEAE